MKATTEGWIKTGDSGTVWLVALVFLLSSGALISLSWDGSFVLYDALQRGVPMLPHGRYASWLLMWPVAWLARTAVDVPTWGFAILQGVMFAVPVVMSFAVMRGMTRHHALARLWGTWGILLLALPGQLCITMEALMVTQIAWPILIFFWVGCPKRWFWVPWVFGVFGFFLHPAGGPLLALAGMLGLYAMRKRGRIFIWVTGLLLIGAGVAKVMLTWLYANSYEQSQLSLSTLISEFLIALVLTPVAMLVPLMVDTVIRVVFPEKAADARYPSWSRWLWIGGLVIGLLMALFPLGWSGALNYRKSAFLLTVCWMVLGAWVVEGAKPTVSVWEPITRRLVGMWAVVFLCISTHWFCQCLWLKREMHKQPEGLADTEAISLRQHSALDHWSIFTISLVMEGRRPTRAVLRDGGKIVDGGIYLFETTGDPLSQIGLTFDLSGLDLGDTAAESE